VLVPKPHRRIVTTHIYIVEIDHSDQICYHAGQKTPGGAHTCWISSKDDLKYPILLSFAGRKHYCTVGVLGPHSRFVTTNNA
jgi:hypothetical protein